MNYPFDISSKVVCVDDNFSKSWDDPRNHLSGIPVKGKIYVIKQWFKANNGEWGIQLVGINSLNTKNYCFYPWRFRKLDEMKERFVEKIVEKYVL